MHKPCSRGVAASFRALCVAVVVLLPAFSRPDSCRSWTPLDDKSDGSPCPGRTGDKGASSDMFLMQLRMNRDKRRSSPSDNRTELTEAAVAPAIEASVLPRKGLLDWMLVRWSCFTQPRGGTGESNDGVSTPQDDSSLFSVLMEKECSILDDWLGWTIQLILLILCCCSLFIKWQMEGGSRPHDVFLLDASKQLVANVTTHVLNMLFAMFLNARSTSEDANECAVFWITLVVDTTCGAFFNWVILKCSEKLLGYKSGCYSLEGASGTLDASSAGQQAESEEWARRFSAWRYQTFAFCCTVVLSQVIMFAAMAWSMPIWVQLGAWGTNWIEDVRLRLLYVMLFSPIAFYTFYFWISDWYLQADEEEGK